MARITIQVLEGFERGRIFADLPTPVTIGREEDNTIQLNDERVSRFHVKIQEDAGRIILTDLDSTNGTHINGHPIQMRVLLPGDQLAIGRSLLLFGSSGEIAEQARAIPPASGSLPSATDRHEPPRQFPTVLGGNVSGENPSSQERASKEERQELFPAGPPPLPAELRMSQIAQLSDLLAYIHDQLATIAEAAAEEVADWAGAEAGEVTGREAGAQPSAMRVDWHTWQRLLALEMHIARYLRSISEPGS